MCCTLSGRKSALTYAPPYASPAASEHVCGERDWNDVEVPAHGLHRACVEPIADIDLVGLLGRLLGVEEEHVIGLPGLEDVDVADGPVLIVDVAWLMSLMARQRNGVSMK